MNTPKPKIDTDYNGEALDMAVAGGVVSMRRHGRSIAFAVVGDVVKLTPDEADDVATALASAAKLARENTPPPTWAKSHERYRDLLGAADDAP